MATIPETVAAIRDRVGKAQNKVEEALRVVGAYEVGKVAPVTLDPQDQRFQTDMSGAQRNELRLDFIALIDEARALLAQAKTLAGG